MKKVRFIGAYWIWIHNIYLALVMEHFGVINFSTKPGFQSITIRQDYKEEVDKIWATYDYNGNGKLDKNEAMDFLKAILKE